MHLRFIAEVLQDQGDMGDYGNKIGPEAFLESMRMADINKDGAVTEIEAVNSMLYALSRRYAN